MRLCTYLRPLLRQQLAGPACLSRGMVGDLGIQEVWLGRYVLLAAVVRAPLRHWHKLCHGRVADAAWAVSGATTESICMNCKQVDKWALPVNAAPRLY